MPDHRTSTAAWHVPDATCGPRLADGHPAGRVDSGRRAGPAGRRPARRTSRAFTAVPDVRDGRPAAYRTAAVVRWRVPRHPAGHPTP
ncbi:hypothetical protein [Streptomyces tauricus]|uniref:hypothetical protein n=1 Tax=Streptomyces tauricus TaxID=68274 RepID=UPI00342D7914